jgi:hypothetical protein
MNNELVHLEAFNVLCGPKLGEGIHRTVFLCAFDPTLVVKVENNDMPEHANVSEWKHWEDLQFAPKFNVWLAPCIRISPEGRVMLQKRTEPIHHRDLPTTMPEWLQDIKQENFGWYDGHIVAHDYPRIMSTLTSRKRKVDWR